MRFLIVIDSLDVDDSSGTKGRVALINNLISIGHFIKILHYNKKNTQIHGATCISIAENRKSFNFLLSRCQRLLMRYLKIDVHKALENIFGFSFTFFNDSKSISKSISKHYINEDIIITFSKGASFRPHYAMLNHPKLYRKWLAYIHDPYPFYYYPKPYNWKEPGYKQKIKFFNKVAKHCKWVAYPSQLLKEWMEDKFQDFERKGLIIPHQIDEDVNISTVLPKYFNSKKFTLLHAGNLMKQRNPIPLIKAFQIFLNQMPDATDNVQLFLIGSASYHKNVLKDYSNIIPQLYVRYSNENFESVMAMQKAASVNIILEAVSQASPFLPGKFPHQVNSNKPILYLGPKNSETLRLLGKDYPFASKANDVNDIAKKINSLYVNWLKNSKVKFDRTDLKYYLSKQYLDSLISQLS